MVLQRRGDCYLIFFGILIAPLSLHWQHVYMPFMKKHASLIFLALGFLFDIITLQRIDQLITLLQHGLFLFVLLGLLSVAFLREQGLIRKTSWLCKGLRYQQAALHFIFGSLLSAFTIFYFKSSSLVTSFLFLFLLLVLLLLNELPRFQKLGLKIKFSLFSLCLISYFSYLVPTLLGFMGIIPLLASVGLVFVVMILLVLILDKPEITDHALRNTITLPCLGVL